MAATDGILQLLLYQNIYFFQFFYPSFSDITQSWARSCTRTTSGNKWNRSFI